MATTAPSTMQLDSENSSEPMANSGDDRTERAPAPAGWGKRDIAGGATLVAPGTPARKAGARGTSGAPTVPPPAGPGSRSDDAVASLFQDHAPTLGVAPPLPEAVPKPPQPPPPAGDDPVGALFAPGSALPAPALEDGPSVAEMSRWEATHGGSMFDEQVKDPSPPAPVGRARGGMVVEGPPPAPAAEAVRTSAVATVGSIHPEAAVELPVPEDDEPSGPRMVGSTNPGRAPALDAGHSGLELDSGYDPGDAVLDVAPEPAAPQGPTIDPRAPGGVGLVIQPAPPVAPAPVRRAAEALELNVELAGAPALPPGLPGGQRKGGGKGRRKRNTGRRNAKGERESTPEAAAQPEGKVKRTRAAGGGRKHVVLILLAMLAVAAGGAVAMFLGLVPNPLAQEPVPKVARGLTRAPAKPKPAPAPAAEGAQQTEQQAKAGAAKTAEQARPQAGAKAETAKPETVQAEAAKAEAVKAEAAKAEAAKAEAAKAEAAKAEAAKAEAAKAEAEPVEEQADEEEDDEGGAANDVTGLVLNAKRLLADEESEQAEALMRRALTIDPRSHHAMELLARALMDQDRGDEAVKYAKKIVQRRKRRVGYRLLLGDALLMTGDNAGAKREWKKALELEPGDKDIQMRLGM